MVCHHFVSASFIWFSAPSGGKMDELRVFHVITIGCDADGKAECPSLPTIETCAKTMFFAAAPIVETMAMVGCFMRDSQLWLGLPKV
ncbi:MAG: hypothetical protein ACI97A_004260 [Planctomycetota bacterium]